MKLEIIAEGGVEVAPEVCEAIEKRMQQLAARFGPITDAKVTVAKAPWHDSDKWKTKAEVQLPPSWIVRPDGGAVALPDALDEMFVEMTALMRHVIWARDGVPHPCRWCAGETFVYVRHPADSDGDSSQKPMRLVRLAPDDWRGELEALVCRDCGHVEWFVGDPQRLPVGTRGVELMTTRKPTPYRDPSTG